MEGKFL